ncbi:hypothetical protein [Coleofasciculus sp.]|uniref:hypothetical protein n=1 Tax=Coleofasciculus sp. TaxID=3100458 RepID=UPI003A2D71A0
MPSNQQASRDSIAAKRPLFLHQAAKICIMKLSAFRIVPAPQLGGEFTPADMNKILQSE